MATYRFHVAQALLAFLAIPGANAALVMNPGDLVDIRFTLTNPICPTGPCDTLMTILLADGAFFAVPGAGSLYNGSSLLGSQPNTSSAVFRSASSAFAGDSAVIDFTTLLDGSINGRLTYGLLSGTYTWTGDSPGAVIFIGHSTPGGGSFFAAQNVVTITSLTLIVGGDVPEPATASLAVLGAGALLILKRRRA